MFLDLFRQIASAAIAAKRWFARCTAILPSMVRDCSIFASWSGSTLSAAVKQQKQAVRSSEVV